MQHAHGQNNSLGIVLTFVTAMNPRIGIAGRSNEQNMSDNYAISMAFRHVLNFELRASNLLKNE